MGKTAHFHQVVSRQQRQRGLSLLWVAIGSAILAILAMAFLYSIRYERNAFVDASEKLLGQHSELGKQSKTALDEAKSAVTGKEPAKNFDGKMYKCKVNGQTTYSGVPCDDKAKELKLHDNTFNIPKPPPPPESAPMNPTDRAIEKATR